jgi:hypothetical protein
MSTQPTIDNKAHEDTTIKANRSTAPVLSESDQLLEQFRRYEI